jgi:hypothetical protein
MYLSAVLLGAGSVIAALAIPSKLSRPGPAPELNCPITGPPLQAEGTSGG